MLPIDTFSEEKYEFYCAMLSYVTSFFKLSDHFYTGQPDKEEHIGLTNGERQFSMTLVFICV